MKSFILVLAGLIMAATSLAQEEQQYRTIFDRYDNTRISGFGGPIMEFSSVNKEFAFSMGGGGAVIFNNTFFLGGYGMGITTIHQLKYEYYDEFFGENVSVTRDKVGFGHGGFWLGYIFKPNNPVHLAMSAKFGWGTISSYQDNYSNNNDLYRRFYDNVFVLTPQLEAEMNITRWFKINLGLGYRLVTGLNENIQIQTDNGNIVNEQLFKSEDFNSLQGTLTLVFGGF